MGFLELFLVAVGLSMDAFAVAICLGLTMRSIRLPKMLVVGLYFGLFQAVMPLIGYLIGAQFADHITAFDHWIAFVLLAFIGGRMVKGSFDKDDNGGEKPEEASLSPKAMLPLALATSIDALAVGVSFAFLKISIVPAVSFIGVITFALSAAGVKIGGVFGAKYKARAELAGGVILILIGLKILLEHLGILAF